MTIKDIAKLCGVGVSTVSRAVNHQPGVRPETREYILKVVEEQGFVPNNSARNLKVTETNTIALLIKGIGNLFFQELQQIFEQELQQLDYSYVIVPVAENQDETKVALELINDRKLCGIIFLGGLIANAHPDYEKIQVPCVRCTVANPNVTVGGRELSVAIDDRQEARRAVDYLIKCGHKKIAILAARPSDSSVGAMRLAGYRQSLEAAGIPFDEKLVARMPEGAPEFTTVSGYETTKALLDSGAKFTALFALSDMMAFGAYKAILERGLRIPEDISVMGFDGLSLTEFFYPPLTTMSQPTEQLVMASIDVLLRAIEQDNVVGERRFFMTELVERSSVRNLAE